MRWDIKSKVDNLKPYKIEFYNSCSAVLWKFSVFGSATCKGIEEKTQTNKFMYTNPENMLQIKI